MILTGDLILESAKRGISFPSNNANGLTDPDILAFAYEEMVSKIMPLMTSLRQEYLIAPVMNLDMDVDTQRIRFPQRALGRTLRNLIWVDVAGNRNSIPQITPEEAVNYMPTTTTSGSPRAFYIENDFIVLVPIPPAPAGEYLELTYPLRPSQIIKVADAGVISTASAGTGTISLVTALPTITTLTPCDIVSSTSGNIIRTIATTPTNVASNVITFPVGDFDEEVIPGDYLCLAEQSPVAGVPEEALVALARATQNRILESIDDLEGLAVGQKILMGSDGRSGLLGDLRELLTPRVEGKRMVALGAANRMLKNRGSGYYPRIRLIGS